MYLKETEIKTLLSRLRDRLGSYTLIFDAFSVFTAKNIKNHPSLKKTGAAINWGIDDPLEITGWNSNIQLIGEKYFTSNEEIQRLNTGIKVMFKMADLFPAAKKAHKILIYKVN